MPAALQGLVADLPIKAQIASILGIGALALIGGLAAACFTKAFGVVFLGAPRGPHAEHAHEVAPAMRLPMALLAAACLAIGLYGYRVPGLLQPAVQVLTGPNKMGLALRPGRTEHNRTDWPTVPVAVLSRHATASSISEAVPPALCRRSSLDEIHLPRFGHTLGAGGALGNGAETALVRPLRRTVGHLGLRLRRAHRANAIYRFLVRRTDHGVLSPANPHPENGPHTGRLLPRTSRIANRDTRSVFPERVPAALRPSRPVGRAVSLASAGGGSSFTFCTSR